MAVSAGATYFAYKNSFEPIYEARIKMMIAINDKYANEVNIFDSIRSSQMAVVDVSQKHQAKRFCREWKRNVV